MAEADDHIAVTIEPDETPGGEGGDAAVTELASQFEEMKARATRAEDERSAALRRAQTAEAAAQQARTEVATVRTEAIDSQAETVESGIAGATEAVTAAKNAIKTAIEAGDPTAQADAYDRLAMARARLERLNEAKTDIAVRKAEAAKPAPRQETAAAPTDQFETYVSQFTDPTARWMREHKDWVTDGRKSLKLNAAHSDALSEGIKPDTPEYFDHVENFIGLRAAETPAPKPPAAPLKQPARRPPVAPVANGSAMNGGGAAAMVRLSKGQATAATDGTHTWNYDDPTGQKRFRKGDPIGIQEMARRVKAQTEQGLFDPNNVSI